MPRTSFLDDEHIRDRVKRYVKASGMLKDAWRLAGYTSERGFFNYLQKHPDFHAELKTLQSTADILTDVELIRIAHDELEQALTNNIHIVEETDQETGELKTLRVIKKPAARWAIEKILGSRYFA